MTTVLIADDQALVRGGMRMILEVHPDIEVVAEAADGREAVEATRLRRPDVVLMDIRMPNLDGIEATRQILRRDAGAPRVLILTTFQDNALFDRALASGAQGFMGKDARPELLVEAIESLRAGGSAFAPTTVAGDRVMYPDQGPERIQLSEREVAILRLMAGGYGNREIARTVFLAEGTVKNYVSDILAKLDARDRTQAVLKAITRRLI